MTPINLVRLTQALALAVVLAALAVPAVALGGSSSGIPAPDWFERYVAAHPSGGGVVASTGAPDVFERYVAAKAAAALTDRRSPDTLDVADAARLRAVDRRSPDTLDVADAARLRAADRRSLGALAAAGGSQPIEIAGSDGFDWGDASIGAIATLLLLGLVGGSMLVLDRLHRRGEVHAT